MRDKERIRPFLEKVGNYWERVPEWRFGQFVLNIMRDPALFYVEDEQFINVMENFFEKVIENGN